MTDGFQLGQSYYGPPQRLMLLHTALKIAAVTRDKEKNGPSSAGRSLSGVRLDGRVCSLLAAGVSVVESTASHSPGMTRPAWSSAVACMDARQSYL